MLGEAVSKAKELTSIESLRTTLNEVKKRIKSREVLKYFSSRTEFAKLLEPITKRYKELLQKMSGESAAATKKPESPLWLELTGMTKSEIQHKAAEEMRFIMINSSFNSRSAKDALNQANSKDAAEIKDQSFYD